MFENNLIKTIKHMKLILEIILTLYDVIETTTQY